MNVTYLDQEHGAYAQYHGPAAGYYRGVARAPRRRAEIAAHAAGVTTHPRVITHAQTGAAPTGAPGLLGGAPSAAEYDARRREAYGPGRLP